VTSTIANQSVPVKIVGSSTFGRFDQISSERTYNMFVSTDETGHDQWLINFAGYESVKKLFDTDQEGRGLFHSIRGGFLLVVVEAKVFRVSTTLSVQEVGSLNSSTGEVFIDENLNSQIAIVDGQNVYIYNHASGQFGQATLRNEDDSGAFQGALTPNYVTYHNTFFIFGNGLSTNDGSFWYIFDPASSGNLNLKLVQTLTLQTKPDYARAIVRMPGRGNNVLVFGESVAEIWTNVGGLQVYQRNSSVNIDYGVASVATIATNDQFVAWLGINERSSPAIMVSTGGNATPLTTDGIDHLLSQVTFPKQSTAIMYRQDHHIFYQLTFYNADDDFTIVYDFTLKKFYDLTDFDYTHAPARQTGHINNITYFVSLKDGHLYKTNVDINTYRTDPNGLNDRQIPRMRICNTVRAPVPQRFIVDRFSFVIESGTTLNAYTSTECFGIITTEVTEEPILTETGEPLLVEDGYCTTNQPRVDLRLSKNGGYTFSNAVSYYLKLTGDYRNQPRFNRLGACQQMTLQLQFWGFGRFVVKNGAMEIRQ